MNRPWPKRRGERLDRQSYQKLHKQILRRDGWRCQLCGRGEDLQVHHIEARSRMGPDKEENLMTLCARCHRRVHRMEKDRATGGSGERHPSGPDERRSFRKERKRSRH